LYLKPVQTGFPVDSDARLVANRHAAAAANVDFDPVALHAPSCGAWRAGYTSFAWGLAASPHLAVEREGGHTPAQRASSRLCVCTTVPTVRAQRRRKHDGGPPAGSTALHLLCG
jgi:dethiobiotin synthetase